MKRNVLRIIALLLLIPLVDIVVLVGIAQWIGGVETIALVVLTALIGMLLVRAEGRHTMRRIQHKLGHGKIPEDELINGAFVIVAGAFFLTPGVVTDFVGLLLALPPTRYPFRILAKRLVITPYLDKKTGGFATGSIYTSGFPNQDREQDGYTYDLGDDEYTIDIDGGSGSED
jgi:UPF0716 protein FxsA